MDDLIAKIKARDDAYNEVEGTIALDDDYEQCAADRRALLGKLAEARELLREARDPVEYAMSQAITGRHPEMAGTMQSLLNRIDAAKAEPKKP